MWQTIKNAFIAPDIRKKILITLFLLLLYRVGCFVPVPGLNFETFSANQSSTANDLFSMMSTITGGSLQYGTVFALGILPFINEIGRAHV